MKNSITKYLLIIPVLLLATCAIAQKSRITGKIMDAKGEPLSGASVKIKSTNTGTITNSTGSFELDATSSDILEVSMVGFASQQISVNGKKELIIVLSSSLTELNEIVFVGSRRGGRIKTETAVPIDVININQYGTPSANLNLTTILNASAPSFNYNKQSGSDGADHIDLGTLRGLGPDQTLVLVNGKRRHQTAFVALFGTRGRGNSGTDLSSFPEIAVDRIEILRDGASAQYGSDAMAGVINVILKKDVNHWTVKSGWAGYYDKKFNALNSFDPSQYYTSHQIDGGAFSLAANNGFALGKKGGFINISLNYLSQANTFRQTPDTNVNTNPAALPLNNSRRAFGDASLKSVSGMYNLELPIGTGKSTFYSFGGVSHKAADAFAYTRNAGWGTERFPIDADGNILSAPGILRKSSDGETYYNPHILTNISDVSIAAGIKGDAGNGWSWDLSNTLGRNDFHFYGDKTFNVSMPNPTKQTHFNDGGFNFTQNTLNLDFSKSYSTIAEGLMLALGGEFRQEQYNIYRGEEASYTGYPTPTGQAVGAQGFTGFGPSDEIKSHRNNKSLYADAELNVTKKWLLEGALRFENYSDFGSILTGKFATRYKITPTFNWRGSISTGFRAPSLQQINFSNTISSFLGGDLVESRLARNGDPITKAAGIPDLKEEKSVNISTGFSWKASKNLTFTADGYMVKVKDRIVLSGLFRADDESLASSFTSQLKDLGVVTAQFFDNAVSTTNYGLDLVVDFHKNWGNKNLKILLAGNIQHVQVDAINVPEKLNDSYMHRKTFFSDREEAFLKASAPKSKFTLSIDHGMNKFGVGARFTYFGNVKILGFGWTGLASQAGTGGPGDPAISGSFAGIDPYVDMDGYYDQVHVLPEVFNYTGKVTSDIYTSYKFSKKVSLFAGVDNLFNVHPDYAAVQKARYESFYNESGGPWEGVQMGYNGLHLYSKLILTF